jgi:hypothetical protein
VFLEPKPEVYTHNALSRALSSPSFRITANFMAPAGARMPEYLKLTNYKNPGGDTMATTPFQFGNNTPLSFYAAMASKEETRKGFDMAMKAHVTSERSAFKTGFASIYDFEGRVGPLIKSDEQVAIVDVDGSQGHVLEDVKAHLPNVKGRLILEELPSTLASITLPPGIEAIPYDFLEAEQPVIGAAVYLFRQIFLNWSDIHGARILANTRSSMSENSKLLIMEPILPPTGTPLPLAGLDFQMMQMGGGLRTQMQWREFLGKNGFELVEFWPSNSNHTIVEAVPKR